jgi:hypoxanthine phosphoribosyltransferase
MTPDSFPCELVTWHQSYSLAKQLARRIRESGFRPDIVIAIGRGGYVPARVVCDFLLQERLTSIKIEHWGIAAHRMERATVCFPLAVDITGQDVLIVDDVTDTGETLVAAVDYLRSLGCGELRTGVLQHKASSVFRPDFCGEQVDEWRWIIYPWAAHEDLVGFTEIVLTDELVPLDEIRTALSERYEIVVDEAILGEVLEDLLLLGKAEQVGSLFRSGRPRAGTE